MEAGSPIVGGSRDQESVNTGSGTSEAGPEFQQVEDRERGLCCLWCQHSQLGCHISVPSSSRTLWFYHALSPPKLTLKFNCCCGGGCGEFVEIDALGAALGLLLVTEFSQRTGLVTATVGSYQARSPLIHCPFHLQTRALLVVHHVICSTRP